VLYFTHLNQKRWKEQLVVTHPKPSLPVGGMTALRGAIGSTFGGKLRLSHGLALPFRKIFRSPPVAEVGMRKTSLDEWLDLEVHEGHRGALYQWSTLAQPYQCANYTCGAFSATAASILSKLLLPPSPSFDPDRQPECGQQQLRSNEKQIARTLPGQSYVRVETPSSTSTACSSDLRIWRRG